MKVPQQFCSGKRFIQFVSLLGLTLSLSCTTPEPERCPGGDFFRNQAGDRISRVCYSNEYCQGFVHSTTVCWNGCCVEQDTIPK